MISKAMLDIQKLTSTFSQHFSQQQSLNILSTTLKTLKHPSNIPQTSLKHTSTTSLINSVVVHQDDYKTKNKLCFLDWMFVAVVTVIFVVACCCSC